MSVHLYSVHHNLLTLILQRNKYRGMGLAQNVAEIFIGHCIEINLKPNWDCVVNNFASIKLAERLGFENPMGIFDIC